MKLIDKTTFKFIIVGIINTLVGTGTMFLAYNLFHANYWISSALNYIVGSVVSYLLNKYYTFNNKDKSYKIVLKFIINITICYLIAYGIAKPLVINLMLNIEKNIQENIAMLVGMILFVGLNYFGQRFFVFKKSKENLENE